VLFPKSSWVGTEVASPAKSSSPLAGWPVTNRKASIMNVASRGSEEGEANGKKTD
jgi:hypothetical protein